jgi:nitrite reductase/ring-hydroxylating ferredoxin subunit
VRRRGRDLDRIVEALLAGDPLPSSRLDADEVEALRVAIELRAARPGADLPGEEFVTELRRRLTATPSARAVPERSGVPRRAFLVGAAGAVAAGVVGAVAESALKTSSPPRPAATGELAPDSGAWVAVAMTSDVAAGQVRRFATASTVGFVSERDGMLAAVSGACTHQGCLLQMNEGAGRLDCPCHRTAFGVDGTVMFSELKTPPAALPKIQVRSRDGQVEAFLPREV